MRSQVEEAFKRQVPDENGLAAREKFVQMLEALGLNKDEAVLLLNECDPLWKSRLPYREFLDFIFGKVEKPDEPKEEKIVDKPPSKEVQNAFCGRPSCLNTPEGTSKYCSNDCKLLDEAEAAAADKPPPEGVETEGSDKDSVQTILTLPPGGNGAPEMRKCQYCRQLHAEVFEDPEDNSQYCEKCWTTYYGSQPKKLVNVMKGRLWAEDKLISAWSEHPIPGWGYRPYPSTAVTPATGDPTQIGEHFFPVYVKLNPGLVGSHARTCTQNSERNLVGEKLCNRYRIEEKVGAGHFTCALLAHDEQTGRKVCVKKHNNITVELLTDLLTIGLRLQSVDAESKYFPQLFDAFYDIDGYTVESLVKGQNCLLVMRERPEHFRDFNNIRVVAEQGLQGLVYMASAGVVHCDLKPDNIMWLEANEEREKPTVILVDFGCSRLDSRLENGRNWALSEGGAGHVGKWAPETVLRLPITHKADVWGLAVALLELHCGRTTWSGEADTVEVILTQVLGLCNARNGVPEHLLRQSPLDIRQLYTPFPQYFPVQRLGTFGRGASFQELRPQTWGLGCVLGPEDSWDEIRIVFANFITAMMNLDHDKRPSAESMLTRAFIVCDTDMNEKIVEDWQAAQKVAAQKEAQKEKEPKVMDAPSVVRSKTEPVGRQVQALD